MKMNRAIKKSLPYQPVRTFHFGADDGNRTHLSSLGSLRSTNELHPHGEFISYG